MVNTPFNRRNNEFEGDMAAYMRSIAPDNDETIERLKRNLRIARREGLPPFLVLSDRTLQEMARLRPRSETAMLAVTGVGKRKLEQYGTEFLDEIRRYSRK